MFLHDVIEELIDVEPFMAHCTLSSHQHSLSRTVERQFAHVQSAGIRRRVGFSAGGAHIHMVPGQVLDEALVRLVLLFAELTVVPARLKSLIVQNGSSRIDVLGNSQFSGSCRVL